jgi:hypothetical protein
MYLPIYIDYLAYLVLVTNFAGNKNPRLQALTTDGATGPPGNYSLASQGPP